MSTPLEQIIRPFVDNSVGPVSGVGSIPQLSQNVTLVITGSGQIKSGGFSYSLSYNDYADAVQTEVTEDDS